MEEKKYFCCPDCGAKYKTILDGKRHACKQCGNAFQLGTDYPDIKSNSNNIINILILVIVSLILIFNIFNLFFSYKSHGYLKETVDFSRNIQKTIEQLGNISKIEELTDESRKATCKLNMSSIESAANIYYAQKAIEENNARYPASIAQLIQSKILDTEPECPSGGKYIFNSNTGVVRCTIHGSLHVN